MEAALLSGVWLFVVFASLLLLFGSFARTWGALTAREAAAYGSFKGMIKGEDGLEQAERRLRRENGGYFATGEGDRLEAGFSHKLKIPYQGLDWEIRETAESRILKPVEFIKKIQALENLKESVGRE